MKPGLVLVSAALVAAGCTRAPDVVAAVSSTVAAVTHAARPAMAWDHKSEAAEWTSATLAAVAQHHDQLEGQVPEDIAAWCPGYAAAGEGERRAFWAGLVSAVAEYESGWNDQAMGAGGRYVGIMQISPRSAAAHDCTAQTADELRDGAANLQCAVRILAGQVGRDGLVAGQDGRRGVGRDWMPFRKAEKRQALAAWTRAQSYCG